MISPSAGHKKTASQELAEEKCKFSFFNMMWFAIFLLSPLENHRTYWLQLAKEIGSTELFYLWSLPTPLTKSCRNETRRPRGPTRYDLWTHPPLESRDSHCGVCSDATNMTLSDERKQRSCHELPHPRQIRSVQSHYSWLQVGQLLVSGPTNLQAAGFNYFIAVYQLYYVGN